MSLQVQSNSDKNAIITTERSPLWLANVLKIISNAHHHQQKYDTSDPLVDISLFGPRRARVEDGKGFEMPRFRLQPSAAPRRQGALLGASQLNFKGPRMAPLTMKPKAAKNNDIQADVQDGFKMQGHETALQPISK